MKNNADISDWREQLQAAVVALEKCPDTPEWLKQVVRDAVSVADDLTPCINPEPAHDAFLYPH
jgi:hypothetical protein